MATVEREKNGFLFEWVLGLLPLSYNGIVQSVHTRWDTWMDELLTTRQVAAELQVSESSVKRWCDQGIIPTQRTAGGHRRIGRADLQEFLATSADKSHEKGVWTLEKPPTAARSRVAEAAESYAAQASLAQSSPAQSSPAQSSPAQPSAANPLAEAAARQELVQRFQQALIAGNEPLCRELVQRWSQRYPGTAQLGDLLIAGAMERIGRLWECGRAEVFEERRSCEILMHVLSDLRGRAPLPGPRAPRALGGTLSGDHYALANQLVELVLREAGWNATSLGGNLPADSLLVAVRRERPRLLWLSISYVPDPETFIDEYNAFYAQLPADLVVAVGGRALTDELRPRIGYTAHCDSLEQLSALAMAMRGAT